MVNDNRDRLREAAQHIKQGDQKSAQVILRDLLKATPNDAEAWHLNSFASNDKNWQIKSLERVLLIAPDHEKAQARLTRLRGTDAPQTTKAAVTAKAPAPTAPSSRPMLVVGGLAGLVVVILGVGVFLSSRPGPRETGPIALAPTASPVIVTRKPTEDLPTETSTVTVENPTFVPTSTRPSTATPTETAAPTETQMEISISLPVPALPTDVSGVGGGTGRILYKDLGPQPNVFRLVDVRDGTTTDLSLPRDVDEAVLSPDGLHIMVKKWTACMGFEPVSPRDPCIGFANADGSSLTMLPNFPKAYDPVFSPDNRQVAFVAAKNNNHSHLWVANIDGSNVRQLTDYPTGEGEVQEPTWSPDGRYIVYALQHTSTNLHVIAADGTGDRVLIEHGWSPSWSPDGRSLAYIAWPDISGSELFVANIDGTNARQLTTIRPRANGFIEPDSPAWSPDGTFIAYTLGGTYYMIRADGSQPPTPIVEVGVYPLDKPSWQRLPDSAVVLAVPTTAPTATATPTSTVTPTSTPVPPTLTPTPTFNPENGFIITAGTGYSSAQMHADPEEYIGRNYADTEGNITLEGTGDMDGVGGRLLINLRIEDNQWTFIFYAPHLELGRTYDVIGGYGSGEVASMTVSSPGKACDTIGKFTIKRVTPEIVVDFVQACGTDQKLSGVVTFRPD